MSIQTNVTVRSGALATTFDQVETYNLKLLYTDITESAAETIDFTITSGNAIMGTSTFFVVPAGKTVVTIRVTRGATNTELINENIAPESFVEQGTFTINSIIVNFADVV